MLCVAIVSKLMAVQYMRSRRSALATSCSLLALPKAHAEDELFEANDDNVLLAHTEARRQIRYYGMVTSRAAMRLNLLLDGLAAESSEPIHLHIQSPGGELLPALYTADLIAASPAPVYTYIDGFAASAATLLSVVGSKRFITPHSTMLLHQLSSSHAGTFDQLQQSSRNDALLMKHVTNLYLQHTTFSLAQLKDLLSRDEYLSAQKCLKHRVVDVVR